MKITQQDVEKVAQLARLAVTPSEKETFAEQLTQILTHVEKLNQYDTAGVEPTSTIMGHMNGYRPSLSPGGKGVGKRPRT